MRRFAGLSFVVAAFVVSTACGDDESTSPAVSSPTDDAGRAIDGSAAADGSGGTIPADGSRDDGAAVDASTSPYRTAVMVDGPVAYWRFDEADGAIAKDEVGAHPGTYFGTTKLGVPGIRAGETAVQLDGKSGCVGIGAFFRFAGRVAFSVEGWVNISTYGKEGTRVVSTEGFPTGVRSGWNLSASYGDTGYPYFDAWNSEGADNLYTMGAYSSVSKDKGKLPLNEWVYLIGTYTDTSEEVWVNGVLRDKQNQSGNPLPNEGTMSLGCASNGSGNVYLPLTGSLDEVAIYDKVLTPAQIESHFAARAK